MLLHYIFFIIWFISAYANCSCLG